jgi:hypothetical protein
VTCSVFWSDFCHTFIWYDWNFKFEVSDIFISLNCD